MLHRSKLSSEVFTTQITPIVQLAKQKLSQVITFVGDIVLVEDTSDDEEVVSCAHVPIEDPILLITIEESSAHSTVEVEVQEPLMTEDPPIETSSSLATTNKGAGLACLPKHPSLPPTTTLTCRRKFHDKSSFRRSVRLARRNVLKDLGFIGEDRKFNETI